MISGTCVVVYGAFCSASAKATSDRVTGAVVVLAHRKVAFRFRASGVIVCGLDRYRVCRSVQFLLTKFVGHLPVCAPRRLAVVLLRLRDA